MGLGWRIMTAVYHRLMGLGMGSISSRYLTGGLAPVIILRTDAAASAQRRYRPMSGQAHIIIKQNEYIRKFRHAGATDATRARTLAELKVKPDRVFRKMRDQAIFLTGRAPETYYLDANAAEDFLEARRRRSFYMLLLFIVVAALMFFLSRR